MLAAEFIVACSDLLVTAISIHLAEFPLTLDKLVSPTGVEPVTY